MHVACFALRAAFSFMRCLVVVMCHVRAVRFVHALCSDMVVLVSALLSLVLVLPLFCLVLCLLFYSCSVIGFCFCLCVLVPHCRHGDQTAGGH